MYNQPNQIPKENKLAGMSTILGIVSIFLLTTGILAIPVGALGVIFSCLSTHSRNVRGKSGHLGLYLSLFGMVFGIMITIMVINTVLHDPSLMKEYQQMLEFMQQQGAM